MGTLEIRKSNGKIYSFIRQKDLVCTPEEEVRQNFICKLVNDFGYPIELMAEEYSPDLKTRGVRSTRADIVIYENEEKKNNDYNAFIVVECKNIQNIRLPIIFG